MLKAQMAKATAILETEFPRVEDGDIGREWPDWLIAHILLREARALTQEQPVKSTAK